MGPWIIILIIAVVVVIALIAMYNSLVALRQQTNNAWSQIDVQLKRRYDLIPNLVETVKKYMDHEQKTLTMVIEARNSALGAKSISEKAAADGAVTQALGSLFALAESYPQLRSNENMLSLQEELKSTENKVAFARQYYNDSVTAYNTKLETFPSSVMASMGNFKPKELFEVDDAIVRESVKVNFD